jgi:hypothetical protein
MGVITLTPDAVCLTDVPPAFQVPSESGYDQAKRRRLEVHHYLLALRNIRFREFFVTANGFIGIGPRGIESRDEIWVIAGFKVPLVFRRVGDCHILVGECFVESDDTMAELTRETDISGERIRIR